MENDNQERMDFYRFRYRDLLSEKDTLCEGIVYAGDFQYLFSELERSQNELNKIKLL